MCGCDCNEPQRINVVQQNGCTTLVVDNVPYTWCNGDNVECEATGIRINGVLCPFPAGPTITCQVDPTDPCYSLILMNGVATGCRFLNQPKITEDDLHVPATLTSPNSTLITTAGGANNQTLTAVVNIPALVSGAAGNDLVVDGTGRLYVNAPAPVVDINVQSVAQGAPSSMSFVLTETDGTAHTVSLDPTSSDAGNLVVNGSDSRSYISAQQIVDGVCADAAAKQDLIACLRELPDHIVPASQTLPLGEASNIAPLNGFVPCAGAIYAVVSGSLVNVTSATINADGTHNVTPNNSACFAGGWSYQYTMACPGQPVQIATVSGRVDNSVVELARFATNNAAGQANNIALLLALGGSYTINWGDGTVQSVASSSGVYTSHTYASAYSGDVVITGNACNSVLYFRSTVGRWSFDIGTLPTGLTLYSNTGNNTTSGDIGTLPSGLTFYTNQGNNTTSGNIGTLPSGLTNYVNGGSNTTSGNIGTLPSGLIVYSNQGNNTTSGDIGTLPTGLLSYVNTGNNTTSGSIGTLPTGLITYSNQGNNTTSGNIGTLPTGLITYINVGNNTTSGSIGALPTGLITYSNQGNNTTSGSIGTLPTGLTTDSNGGANTTSGDIGTLPTGLIYYANTGNNTTSGSIGTLPSGLTYYANQGNNTTTAPTAAWSAATTGFQHFLNYGVPGTRNATQVNNMLIALTNVTSWAGAKQVFVNSTANAAPTAPGLAAKATILANGAVSVAHN